MCFSAGVSFTSAAILIPAGLLCLNRAARMDKSYWAVALLPIAFGIQQIFEGFVWRAIETNDANTLHLSALGFLFFSHFFWLTWIPATCYFVESNKNRRTLFLLMTGVGATFGALMFIPLLVNPGWMTVSIMNHSILYKTTLIYDGYIPSVIGTMAYTLVMLPFMLSSDKYLRLLGLLILFSMIMSLIFFSFAFISVWCFFAAVVSLYIYYMILFKVGSVEAQSKK